MRLLDPNSIPGYAEAQRKEQDARAAHLNAQEDDIRGRERKAAETLRAAEQKIKLFKDFGAALTE